MPIIYDTLLLRRGLAANRTSFVPLQGEPLFAVDTDEFYIGDGTTPGGVLINSDLIENGGYLYSNFRQPGAFFDGTEWGSLAYSADGINYAEIYGLNSYRPPSDGVHARGVRDCSIIKIGDTYFIIHTISGGSGSGYGLGNSGVISSPDLINWTHVTDVIASGAVGFAAPRWFIDLPTGNRWAIGQTGDAHFILIQNTSDDGITWINQTGNLTFDGSGDTINGRDAYIVYKDGTYYLYWFDYDDEPNYHLATNSSLTAGGWIDQGAQSFSNAGEGVCVFLRPDGNYMGYISAGSIMKYFVSSSAGSLTSWNSLQTLNLPPSLGGGFGGQYDNGTVWVVQDSQTKQDALGALIQRIGFTSPVFRNLVVNTAAVSPTIFIGPNYDNNNNVLALNGNNASGKVIGIAGGESSGLLSVIAGTNATTNFANNDGTNYRLLMSLSSSANLTINGDCIAGGNLLISTVGKGLRVKEGSNAKQGVATLSSGTVTVSNNSVTSNSRIFVSGGSLNSSTAIGALSVPTITNGTSFVITSYIPGGTSVETGDLRTINYEIFEPA